MLSEGAAGALIDWKVFFIPHHFSKIPHNNTPGTHCTVLCPNKQLRCRENASYVGDVLDQKAKKTLLIMKGDFNAKIGKDNIGKELVLGRRALVR